MSSDLEAKGVHAWFSKHHALSDVSITFNTGSVTALIGPSGCGKSTFIRTLNRMHEFIPGAAMAGEVLLNGKDIYEKGTDVTKIRLQIGMVFQKPNPFPKSIFENVAYGLRVRGVRRRSVIEKHVTFDRKLVGPDHGFAMTMEEFADMVQNFNDLLKQRRWAEAELIAKKAKELDPENPTAEIMKWKAKFAMRNASNDELKDRKETVVFLASFLSVLFLDLFGAVIVGSVLAILYSKWEQAHPNISVRDNVLKIRGNIYYGSLPVIEAMYHQVIQRKGSVVLDISDCYYIDNEGIRWIAAAKASQKAALADRRRGDRRERAGGGDKSGGADKAGGKRRDRPDRRRRSEF